MVELCKNPSGEVKLTSVHTSVTAEDSAKIADLRNTITKLKGDIENVRPGWDWCPFITPVHPAVMGTWNFFWGANSLIMSHASSQRSKWDFWVRPHLPAEGHVSPPASA